MKRILYILYVAIFFILIHGCKKDIGNYDYTETPVVILDTTGLGGTFRVAKFGNLKISPSIKIPDGHEVGYQWLIYGKQVSNTSVPVAEEISTEFLLDVPVSGNVGDYTAELIVTDKTTGLKTNVLFNVNISANMDFGMMILYQTLNGGDVDFIRTPALSSDITEVTHAKGLYSQLMGRYIPGNAKFIGSARQAYQTPNWITVGSDSYLGRFVGDDFRFIRDQEDIFRRAGQVIKPQAYAYGLGLQQMLINDGKFTIALNAGFENDIKFQGPADGDYELAPYLSSKVSSSFIAVGYDQKNSRFVRYFSATNSVGSFATSTNQVFNLNNIGKNILYMTSGVANNTFAFFKDKDTERRTMYEMNFSSTPDNGTASKAIYDMTSLPEISSAKFYQVSGFGRYAYYATTDKIYNYAYGSSNTASVAFTVPSDEEIICIRYYRPTPNSMVAEKEERVLYVATWNGTRTKVFELAINETSGTINPAPLNVFEVNGKVVDMSARAKGFG